MLKDLFLIVGNVLATQRLHSQRFGTVVIGQLEADKAHELWSEGFPCLQITAAGVKKYLKGITVGERVQRIAQAHTEQEALALAGDSKSEKVLEALAERLNR